MLGLAVSELAVNPNITNPAVKMKAFRAAHKITYPLLSDEDQTVFDRFGGGGIPSCVLIDRQGRFVARLDADTEEAESPKKLKAEIEKLLNADKPG